MSDSQCGASDHFHLAIWVYIHWCFCASATACLIINVVSLIILTLLSGSTYTGVFVQVPLQV